MSGAVTPDASVDPELGQYDATRISLPVDGKGPVTLVPVVCGKPAGIADGVLFYVSEAAFSKTIFKKGEEALPGGTSCKGWTLCIF